MDEDKRNDVIGMEARMYAPLEWDSSAMCKIQDLKEAQFEEALRLIKVEQRKNLEKTYNTLNSSTNHFFREEPMCKAIAFLEDQTSVNAYLNFLRIWMKDTTSLVALSLTSGRIVGVAVLRINSDSDKSDIYNRVQNFEGDALEKVMSLINALIKQTDIYREFGCDIYLRIHVLCVHPSYQRKGVGAALLKTCVQVASSLGISAVGGVFTSGLSQLLALKLGFRFIAEIRYGRWFVNDRIVFDDTGKGNYSAAFMGTRISHEE